MTISCFVAVFRPHDVDEGEYQGQVTSILNAEDFVQASEMAQKMEAKMEQIGFTLSSVTYQE